MNNYGRVYGGVEWSLNRPLFLLSTDPPNRLNSASLAPRPVCFIVMSTYHWYYSWILCLVTV